MIQGLNFNGTMRIVTCGCSVQATRRRDTDVENMCVDSNVGSAGGKNLQDSDSHVYTVDTLCEIGKK